MKIEDASPPTASLDFRVRPITHLPIPNRLNLALSLGVFTAAVILLWAGSRVQNGWAIGGIGIVFSYVLLTNYALLHEASHGNLQSHSRRNNALGILAGLLFPMPFTLMRSTHQGHHDHNRTDVEMFDLYYPHDSRLLKCIRWYGILCGFFWPIIPLGAVIFSVLPRAAREKLFYRFKPTGYLLDGVQNAAVWRVRIETVGIALFFAALCWLLDLRWQNTLVLYLCFAFNWSTRQYIGHAFSKRDVIEGAWNLRHLRWMSWLLLHGEYDLNHHRHPEVPWYYLPEISPPNEKQPGYLRQYWRQWLGPRPNTETAPVSTDTSAPASS